MRKYSVEVDSSNEVTNEDRLFFEPQVNQQRIN